MFVDEPESVAHDNYPIDPFTNGTDHVLGTECFECWCEPQIIYHKDGYRGIPGLVKVIWHQPKTRQTVHFFQPKYFLEAAAVLNGVLPTPTEMVNSLLAALEKEKGDEQKS